MTTWMTAKEGAAYAKQNYRDFIKELQEGRIRSVKRGRKFLTTPEWIDNSLLSLEKKSMLVAK